MVSVLKHKFAMSIILLFVSLICFSGCGSATKDWGITVNGTYVRSLRKYKVTPNNTKLIDSVDNDNLPGTMK